MEQANKESRGEQTSWNVAQIKAYFCLSGGWDLEWLVFYFSIGRQDDFNLLSYS
jgi:prenylcysteine alpha-carboxyl methylesterase